MEACAVSRPVVTEVSTIGRLFVMELKSQRPFIPLLTLVLALMLLLGQASSYVLADRNPPLSIAVQIQGEALSDDASIAGTDDAGAANSGAADNILAIDFVQVLSATQGLEVIEVPSSQSPEEVFGQHRVQGLVVISADFTERILQGRHSPVMLHSAPGITNIGFARELVASAILQVKARSELERALEAIGLEEAISEAIEPYDLFEVIYEGPLLQTTLEGSTPAFGVSALLVLLAFLQAALTIPTRENKRLLVYGSGAYLQKLAGSFLVIWLVWLVLCVLFFGFLALLTGAAPSMFALLGFLAIAFYVSVLAALLAQFLGRHATSWVFIPLFLFNMTIGGGLWGSAVVSPLLAPLTPVSVVSAIGDESLTGIIMLFVTGLMLLGALVAVIRFKVVKQPRPSVPAPSSAVTSKFSHSLPSSDN